VRLLIVGLCAGMLAVAMNAPPTEAAEGFDLVYVDSLSITLTPSTRGFILGEYGFAVLVNTGDVPLIGATLEGMSFSSTSSVPNIRLSPDGANIYAHTPIVPGEAVGSVESRNALLLKLLVAGESFRNTAPDQVLAFHFLDMADVYEGPVAFDIRMTMGSQECQFQIGVDLHLGDNPGFTFLHARRVSSTTTVPVAPVTWGRLKSLYR
jgi:hypothetical protein